MESLKSREPAVQPVARAVTPGTLPRVAGITWPRSVSSARLDAASVPLPSIGTSTRATRRDVLTSTAIGSCMRPLASAARLSAAMPAVTCGRVTSGALTTTTAGPAPPGKTRWMRV